MAKLTKRTKMLMGVPVKGKLPPREQITMAMSTSVASAYESMQEASSMLELAISELKEAKTDEGQELINELVEAQKDLWDSSGGVLGLLNKYGLKQR